MKLKNILFLVIFLKFIFVQVSADISFSEVFPNTTDDTNLEYIELYNSGDSEVNIGQYIFKDKTDKQYVFPETEFLGSNEKKKYYSTQTKILLNNSNEELYLIDSVGIEIDSYSYDSTIKGEVIYIGDKEIKQEETEEETEEIEEKIEEGEDEGEGEGESSPKLLSGSVEDSIVDNIESDLEENKGGDETEKQIEKITYESPEIIYSFQSPTYLLEKENTTTIYNCDRLKDTCKINLDFRNSFIGDFKESDFICETNFGFTSEEKDKCKPATIIIPVGTYDFNIKIINKNDKNIFSEKSFKVINKGYLKPEIKKTVRSGGGSKKKNTGVAPVIISKPEIIIQSGLNKKNECNNIKNCNVNFKYIEKSKFEKCYWEFSNGKYEPGVNTKCNPSSVHFGTGKFEINLRVFERGDYNNFKTTNFIFSNGIILDNEITKNTIIKEEVKKELIKNKKDIEIIMEDNLKNTKLQSIISLQGKIGSNKVLDGNTLTCFDSCSINFDGTKSTGDIKNYSWNFGNGEKFIGKNPPYIKYKTYGNYKINLLVISNSGDISSSEFNINFYKKQKAQKKSIINKVSAENSNEQKKIESISDYANEIIIEPPQTDNKYTLLLYLIIGLFSAILFTLILLREKLF